MARAITRRADDPGLIVAASTGTTLRLAQEQYGVSEELAVDLIDSFKALVAEWEAKLEGVDMMDQEKLTELFVEEIYKKVDPATYGVN